MALTIGSRLGPFKVVAQIGKGGMGEVYRALDTGLNRDVALKVLLPEIAARPDLLGRFRREAQILASLNHPNIAQIYGLEDGTSATALVLELVEGPTLADRIEDGPLSLELALPIATQVVEALAAAHGQGIVHRDLKPANIKVRADGTVKLLDFGLARAAVTAQPALGMTDVSTVVHLGVTSPGTVMGTFPYMSPEQTRGMPLDHQTDIWAFGCVLYEMLVGRRAFCGNTTSDVIAAVLSTEPDWSLLPISTQSRLGKLLKHCLEKRPQRRLDDIAAAKAIFVDGLARHRRRGATGGDVGRLAPRRPSTQSRTVRRSDQAVVPSTALAPLLVFVADTVNSTGQEIFDRTLTSIAKGALERSSFITVLQREHASTLSDMPLSESAVLLLAVRQRASVVLSSSVAIADDRYCIVFTARQVLTGAVVCSVNAVCSIDDVVRNANKLLRQVRRELGDSSTDTSVLFAQLDLSTTSLEAIRYHADALDASSRGSFQASFDCAQKAIELDPKFGVGYVALAVASHNLGRVGAAVDYLRQALQHLDGMTERERLSTRGAFYQFTGEYRLGLREFDEMVRRYAGDPIGHNQLACCHEGLHQFAQAVGEMRKVVELLPNRAVFRANLALYAAFAGDFQTAEREASAALELGMEKWGLLVLGRAQFGQGRLTEAEDTFAKLERIDPASGAISKAALAAYEGRFKDAIAICWRIAQSRGGEAAEQGWALALRAYLHQLQRSPEAALDAAQRALDATDDPDIRLKAAIVCAQLGAVDRARDVAKLLADSQGDKAEAFSALVEAEILLNSGAMKEAVRRFSFANDLIDTWFGHFGLGRAYLRSGSFVQAESELDRCVRRGGELLLGDNIAYLPAAYLHQGHARQGLKNAGFADSFGAYLKLRGVAGEDPQLEEIRQSLTPG